MAPRPGVVLVVSRDLGDAAALPAAVVAGGFAAIVALFALLVTETDEAFANVYSAAVSLQNVVPRAPQKLLIVLVTVIATAGALVIDLVSYQSFLLLLGSVFVPLFAVLLADWLSVGRHYAYADVFGTPAWRPGLIAAWVAGFTVWWLYPTASWWVDLVSAQPAGLGIGATVRLCRPFGIASVLAVIARRPSAERRRMTLVAAIGHHPRRVPLRHVRVEAFSYAARALARLGTSTRVAVMLPRGSTEFLPPSRLSVSISWHESSATTAYSFHYEGSAVMWQDAVGDPWTRGQVVDAAHDAMGGRVRLTRTDFPPALAALAAKDVASWSRCPVRTAAIGPLRTDGDIGDVLHHLEVLKLNDEEARTLVGSADPERLRALGVPEVLLTLGSQGSWVITPEHGERVAAVEIERPVDPTGAGDTYSVTYLVHRAEGAEPVEAARLAAETVSAFLASS
jgi:hypothetical protein